MKNKLFENLNTFTAKVIIVGVLLAIFFGIIIYFWLPAFNFQNFGFLLMLAVVVSFILVIILSVLKNKLIDKGLKNNKRYTKIRLVQGVKGIDFSKSKVDAYDYYNAGWVLKCAVLAPFAFCIIFGIFCNVVGAELFRADDYYKQLKVENGTEEEFKEIYNYDSDSVLLPVIDKDLAFRLAEAKLGEYGAQYTIDYENFTLISVEREGQTKLVRIAPLEYDSVFVSIARKNIGTIGYIEVDVVNKEATLVKFDDGLKYMPSAILDYDLDRHIRFNYLSALYTDKYFEIDDEGTPYWVIPTYYNEIFLYSGATPNSVITVNAITGEHNEYEIGSEPSWVDRVINENVVSYQATNSLRYKNGFFNAVFGSKQEVFQLSDGYNYFIKDNHTYYVSCITSPNENDQTSIGFMCIDLKNNHATRYSIAGITEMRARQIAQMDERVKAQDLDSTWPILINYRGIPTYFLVLKNDVQAQKIVFVNVFDGSCVAIANTPQQAKTEYNKLISQTSTTDDIKTVTSKVVKLRDLGQTIEFMVEDIADKYFVVDVSISLDARFLNLDDIVELNYVEYGTYNYVTEIKTK